MVALWSPVLKILAVVTLSASLEAVARFAVAREASSATRIRLVGPIPVVWSLVDVTLFARIPTIEAVTIVLAPTVTSAPVTPAARKNRGKKRTSLLLTRI